MMIRLRGHHLLCIHGFQGMGYSDSFVEIMKEITYEIRDNPKNTKLHIQVLDQVDQVCRGCPHLEKNRCLASEDSNQHVTDMDLRVITHLNIEAGKIYSKQELLTRTQQFVEPYDLDYLCAGCSWLEYGVCKKGIQNLKDRNLHL